MPDRNDRGVVVVLVLLCAVAVAEMLAPAAVDAATVTIYGKGGVRIWPPAVCPEESPAKCATIEWDACGPNPYVGTVTAELTGQQYTGYFPNPLCDTSAMQGSDLPVDSLVPIQ